MPSWRRALRIATRLRAAARILLAARIPEAQSLHA
jgi:hypothetical protein